MLRRPHLSLANLGGDVRVAAARRLEQRLDRARRHDVGVGFLLLREVEAAGRAPVVDTPPPFAEIARLMAFFLPRGDQRVERASGVAEHRAVDGDALVDRAAVGVVVDLLRWRREGIEAAGDADRESAG